MAIPYVDGNSTSGTGITGTFTHGLTINSGDFVLATLNRNSSNASVMSMDADSGGTWIPLVEEVGHNTNRVLLAYKIANGSEPADYNFTPNLGQPWSITIDVWRPDTTTAIDVSPISQDNTPGSTLYLVPNIDVASGARAIAVTTLDAAPNFDATIDNSYIYHQASPVQLGIAVASREFASAASTGITTFGRTGNETSRTYAFSIVETGGGGGTVIEDAGGSVDVDLGDLSVTVSGSGTITPLTISGSGDFSADLGVTVSGSGTIAEAGTITGSGSFAGDLSVSASGSGTITPAITVSGSGDYSADIAVTANGSGTITPPGSIGGSGSFSASIGVSASGSGSVTDGSVVPHTVTITSTNVLRREQNHFVLPISIRDINGGDYSPVTAHWRLDDPDTDVNLSPDQSITPQADINLLVPASVLDMNDEAQLTERRILTFTTNRGLPTETNTQYSFPLENLEFV